MVRARPKKRLKLNEPEIGRREIKAVKRVLRSGTLTQGPETVKFEKEFSIFCGVANGIAVTSATSGLQLGLWSLGIGSGDEVIVPDFSWPASGNSVIAVGAKPVFADIRLDTFNIDEANLSRYLSPATKAIMPVHAFGHMANMPEIMKFAKKHSLLVIEDAACAIGSHIEGLHAGNFGDVSVFSFHPRKVLTTGEGGMVVTPHQEVAERAKRGRVHGSVRDGSTVEFVDFGFNYRMTEFQASMGRAQLARHNEISLRRERNASLVIQRLQGIKQATLPITEPGYHHSYQSFVVLLDEKVDRLGTISTLDSMGIEATLGTYSHLAQPSYSKKFGTSAREMTPNSTLAYNQALSLPVHGQLSPRDIDRLGDSLASALAQNQKGDF